MTTTTNDELTVGAGRSPKATEVSETPQQANQNSPLPGTDQDGKNEQKHTDQSEEKAGFGNFWVIAA